MNYKIGIIGLGSLGAAYGSMAMDANNEISFICDDTRYKKYSSSTFTVNQEPYDFHFINDHSVYFDLILITVKMQHLDAALEELKLYNTTNTIIISVINGIQSEDLIQRALPDSKVLHGYTVKTDGQKKDCDFNYSNRGRIVFGAPTADLNTFADKGESILKAANIPHQKVDNIEYKMWWKLMLNVGINQSSAILKTPYGKYEDKHVQAVSTAAMKEVLEISKAAGVNLKEEDIQASFSIFKSLNPENKTSMLQDLEAGRKTEIDIFAGEIIRQGKKYGIPTPINSFLYHSIKYLEDNFCG